jgi:hypothetical protein
MKQSCLVIFQIFHLLEGSFWIVAPFLAPDLPLWFGILLILVGYYRILDTLLTMKEDEL